MCFGGYLGVKTKEKDRAKGWTTVHVCYSVQIISNIGEGLNLQAEGLGSFGEKSWGRQKED